LQWRHGEDAVSWLRSVLEVLSADAAARTRREGERELAAVIHGVMTVELRRTFDQVSWVATVPPLPTS
jgi:hypothetical protein